MTIKIRLSIPHWRDIKSYEYYDQYFTSSRFRAIILVRDKALYLVNYAYI